VLPEAERQAITAAEATASKLQKETPERLLVDVNALLAKIKQSDCEFQDGVDRFNDAISKANRHMAEADRGLDDVLVDMHWGTVMGRTLLIVLVLSVPAVWFGGWWLGIAVTILAAPAVYFLVRKLFLRALGNSAH
jgi:hypothetical protein